MNARTLMSATFVALLLAACQTIEGSGPEVVSAGAGSPAGGKLPTYSIAEFKKRAVAPMSTAELKASMIGKTWVHKNLIDGRTVTIRHHSDGKREVTVDGSTVTTRYEIRDNQRCDESVRGGTVCVPYYKVDGKIIGCDPHDNGVCDWVVTDIR